MHFLRWSEMTDHKYNEDTGKRWNNRFSMIVKMYPKKWLECMERMHKKPNYNVTVYVN